MDSLSVHSVSDIRVCAADAEKGIQEEDRKAGDVKVGGRETLFQLRKRSRKRRSFMETEYTSRVSYPEPEAQSKQDLVSNKLHESLLNRDSEAQTLSSDPEPSEQTQNPSPTVSSLTHSEGEPAQLESKPILSKPYAQGSGCELGTHERIRDPQTPSRTRKQEMEMEPDAMESKSVTDLVKAPSPTITVVRRRVDPDGKESADRSWDGTEEIEEGKAGEKREGKTCVSENGPFTSHMFLPEMSEKDSREKGAGEEQRDWSSSKSAEGQSEDTAALCLMDGNTKSGNGLLGTCLTALEQHSYVEEYMLEGLRDEPKPLSFSPPPPPPSSPLPLLPANYNSQSDCLQKEGGNKNTRTSIKVLLSTSEEFHCSPEIQLSKGNHSDKAHVATTSVNEDEVMGAVSCTFTASDELTDSTNSDNVFDDDEVSISLNSSSSDNKYDWVIAAQNSISANSEAVGKSNSPVSRKSCMSANTVAHTRICSVSADYTRTINSIAAKLGAATSGPSSTFNSSAKLKSEDILENISKPKINPTPSSVAGTESIAISSLAMANIPTVHDVSKDPSSPTHFFFQTCSPSIMGRLSASTLRGKIQQLPLFLSRSQETVNQAGVSGAAQSPVEDNSTETTEITISVTDINNVTETINLDVGTTSVDSDDSDTTVTGSEVDGDFFIETIPSKNSVFEEKGLTEPSEASCETSPCPVQTEPKHENQPLCTGLDNNTPGPIRHPPASIVRSLQQGLTSGLHMDTPGPIKNAPESKMTLTELGEDVPGKISSLSPSIPPSIVVTTQNLNGPGISFHSMTQEVRRSSSIRPLIGLCRPTEQKVESADTFSSGCRVFTNCKDSSQTKTPVDIRTRPCLKSEVSCSSVLASGCESVVEGMQMPLDACGCPSVYTNCINDGDSFDEELTVYEFSCRTQSSGVTQMSGTALPLMTTPPVHSFLSTSSTHTPSFSRSVLSSSSASELSPLLSPLSEASDCFLSQMHKETVSRLGQQRYPAPPAGFQVLRVDVDQLLTILESSSTDRSVANHRGRHPRETCPSHFTENKRVLQIEARRLMSGCQKVVGIGQSPEEMLHSLADSFRTLVELADICLWFSGCNRCDRRNAEAVAGLADVARSFRDFCLAAERANSKRTCEDLSTKLLAKQCTALTASVFCLTQLFRTLTAL